MVKTGLSRPELTEDSFSPESLVPPGATTRNSRFNGSFSPSKPRVLQLLLSGYPVAASAGCQQVPIS